MRARGAFDSSSPPCVHTAPAARQFGDDDARNTTTSSHEAGFTVTVQRRFSPFITRFAFVTRSFSTLNAESFSVRKLSFTSSENTSSKLNALLPSCSAGTPWNAAVSTVDALASRSRPWKPPGNREATGPTSAAMSRNGTARVPATAHSRFRENAPAMPSRSKTPPASSWFGP